jgi:hypothetical protein
MKMLKQMPKHLKPSRVRVGVAVIIHSTEAGEIAHRDRDGQFGCTKQSASVCADECEKSFTGNLPESVKLCCSPGCIEYLYV